MINIVAALMLSYSGPIIKPPEGCPIKCNQNENNQKYYYCHYAQGNNNPQLLCLPVEGIENGHSDHEHDHYATLDEFVYGCDEI